MKTPRKAEYSRTSDHETSRNVLHAPENHRLEEEGSVGSNKKTDNTL